MKFVQLIGGGYDVRAYREYLHGVESRLPNGARNFFLNEWHYDPTDHRCPHDCWLEELTVRELHAGERREKRTIQIAATFLGAYHNGRFKLVYDGVVDYSFHWSAGARADDPCVAAAASHQDWHADELILDESGAVTHEVAFQSLATWKIVCADVVYEWIDGL